MQQNNIKIAASARAKRSVHKMMKQNNKTKEQLRLECQKEINQNFIKLSKENQLIYYHFLEILEESQVGQQQFQDYPEIIDLLFH